MAATKTSALGVLAYTYDRGMLAKYERTLAKFYTKVQKAPGTPQRGQAINWAIPKRGSHSARVIAEGGDYPTYNNPSWMQPSTTVVEVAGPVSVTELLAVIGQGQGFIGDGAQIVADYVKNGMKEAVFALERQALGYYTGKIGEVATTTDTSTTVPLAWPEGAALFRENYQVDFYNTDTGGSKQGATETVEYVSYQGPEPYIVIDTARTLTAGWDIYLSGEYGICMTGLRQIVDNGTLTSTIWGITRSTSPEINATVFSASGGLQPFSEQLVNQALEAIGQVADSEIDVMMANSGMPAAQRDALAGSRIFTVSPTESVPSYDMGFDTSKLGFQYNGKRIPWEVNRNMPARSIYGLTWSLFRKYIAKELDWVGDGTAPDGGSGSPIWLQTPGTAAGTYASSKTALFNAFVAMGHKNPRLNFLISDVVDNLVAGDVQ